MTASLDVAIFGGGIAGLWALARLRRAGHGAALFETGALGGGQTLASQGIVHGGMKYALGGEKRRIVETLAGMPARWRAALAGEGEAPLPAAALRAPHHLTCVPDGLGATFLKAVPAFFRARRLQRLAPADWPADLHASGFSGAVLAFDEPVVDVPLVVRHLAERHRDRIFAAGSPAGLRLEPGGDGLAAAILADGSRIEARRFLFTAGAGIETVLATLGAPAAHVATQRRPLRMALLRGELPDLHCHLVDSGIRPLVSITSHRDAAGRTVWYLGGDLAERGVSQSDDELAGATRALIARLLPGVAVDACEAAAFAIDRAEPAHVVGRLADEPVIATAGNALLAWPSKLAFAPLLADRLAEALAGLPRGEERLPDLPPPPLGAPPWERVSWS